MSSSRSLGVGGRKSNDRERNMRSLTEVEVEDAILLALKRGSGQCLKMQMASGKQKQMLQEPLGETQCHWHFAFVFIPMTSIINLFFLELRKNKLMLH